MGIHKCFEVSSKSICLIQFAGVWTLGGWVDLLGDLASELLSIKRLNLQRTEKIEIKYAN